MDEGREEEAFDAAGDGGPSPNVHDKPLDAADGEDERTCAPSGGVPDMLAPDGDDDAPGMAVGEDKGRPMRFAFVYERPVDVVLDGERAVAPHPPFDGRVRVRPKRKNARAVVVAVDDLDDAGRRALRAAPTRRRIEVHVRCRVRHCAKVYRAWLCKDMTIQDTRGREIGPVEDLFAARCSNHGPTKKGGIRTMTQPTRSRCGAGSEYKCRRAARPERPATVFRCGGWAAGRRGDGRR